MRQPFLVSVVIPAFNPGRYLPLALESVRKQTYAPCEVIVVDDGSDPPISLSNSPGTSIRLIRQNNQGQAAARNLGLRMSAGEFVAFLDADDVWHPRKIELQVEAIRHTQADVMSCRAVLIDCHGLPIARGPGGLSGKAIPLSRAVFLQQAPLAILVPSMVLARRTVLLEAPGFDTAFQPIEDLVFFDRLFLRGARIETLEEPFLMRRIHGDSLTLKFDRMDRAYRKWVCEVVAPSTNDLIAREVLAQASIINGLSALVKNRPDVARHFFRRSWKLAASGRALGFFALACLGSRPASFLRNIKQAWSRRNCGANRIGEPIVK